MSLVDNYQKQAWEWFNRADQMSPRERLGALDIAWAWLRKASNAGQPGRRVHETEGG
jgi:hypothetical protein